MSCWGAEVWVQECFAGSFDFLPLDESSGQNWFQCFARTAAAELGKQARSNLRCWCCGGVQINRRLILLSRGPFWNLAFLVYLLRDGLPQFHVRSETSTMWLLCLVSCSLQQTVARQPLPFSTASGVFWIKSQQFGALEGWPALMLRWSFGRPQSWLPACSPS